MNNFTFQDLESLLNNESATRQLDNASDLISKYGDNLMFLRTANKQLEESRLLTPIAVREHFTQPYKMGLINDDLEIVIEPKYDTIVDDITQKNQLIRVGLITPVIYGDGADGISTVHLKLRFGVVDTMGNTILEPKYDGISFDDNYSLIVITNGPTSIVQGAGLFNRKGKEIVPIGKYRKIFGFSKGLARVVSSYNNNKWGIIDKNGNEILPAEYDQIWNFEGKDVDSVRTVKNGVTKDYGFEELLLGNSAEEYNADDLPF